MTTWFPHFLELYCEDYDVEPDYVVQMRSFAWLGTGWQSGTINEPITFDEWKLKHST